jgi:single-strand DNA-binding protein
MASFNKIIIVGHLGKDHEIRYMTDGTAVCNFSVATTEKRKDRSGDMQENTLWFRVNVWGKQADAVNQYLSKGRQVYVEGRLSQQEYTDKDGNRRTSLEVRATDVQFLGARGDEGGTGATPSSRPATALPPGGEENEDIPF